MGTHDHLTDPVRVINDHGKVKNAKRMSLQKQLENKNVKMAFHIHKQSASIDVKKQISDFEQHRKLLQMHGKYRNNKVWGGALGSVSHKSSPKKFELK